MGETKQDIQRPQVPPNVWEERDLAGLGPKEGGGDSITADDDDDEAFPCLCSGPEPATGERTKAMGEKARTQERPA